MKEITIDGVVYVPKVIANDLIPIIGIIDNRGLTYVGYSNLKRDKNGYITIIDAQCIIQWYTGAHLNYLVNGVCEGVTLGAKADIKVNELYQIIELPFSSIEDWKNKKLPKGNKEVM